MTEIFTTKKLEKIIHKKLVKDPIGIDHHLGCWNASVFYIAKKKCILLTHAKTFFSVVIPRFSMKEIDIIDSLFIENLYHQFLYEKIEIDLDTVVSIVGNVNFYSTNNNRQMTGVLNYNIEKLNDFKYEYAMFNASVIREMTEKLNRTPFKQLGWKVPHEKMVDLLNEI